MVYIGKLDLWGEPTAVASKAFASTSRSVNNHSDAARDVQRKDAPYLLSLEGVGPSVKGGVCPAPTHMRTPTQSSCKKHKGFEASFERFPQRPTLASPSGHHNALPQQRLPRAGPGYFSTVYQHGSLLYHEQMGLLSGATNVPRLASLVQYPRQLEGLAYLQHCATGTPAGAQLRNTVGRTFGATACDYLSGGANGRKQAERAETLLRLDMLEQLRQCATAPGSSAASHGHVHNEYGGATLASNGSAAAKIQCASSQRADHPVDSRAKVPLVEHCHMHSTTTRLPTLLARPADVGCLSNHQILLRLQIEVFQATQEDLSTHTRGRNTPIRVGQVGIRCRHCAHLPVKQRQKGSVYFPASILGIYQAAQNMNMTHIQCGLCSEMPNRVKEQFSHSLALKNANSGAGRKFWAISAQQFGLVDTDKGIFLAHDVPEHVNVLENAVAATIESSEKMNPRKRKATVRDVKHSLVCKK